MLNIGKNISPKELRNIAATQNTIQQLHAKTEAAEIRKQINQELLNAATKGDTFCFIEKPQNKYVAAELISILKAEGFKVISELTYLEQFIEISWEEDTDKLN